MLGSIALLAAVALVGAVLLMRQFAVETASPAPQTAAPAGQPAAQTDWKSKGAPNAAVVVEEWGDFQ